MDGMRDPDPGSWLALRGRRRASPKVEGWVLRFDRAFNIFHPGTCGLRTGPNIINLTVQFIQKRKLQGYPEEHCPEADKCKVLAQNEAAE